MRDTVGRRRRRSARATGSRSRATASSRRTRSPADAVCELLGKLVDDDSEIVTVLVGCRRRGQGHRAHPRAHRGQLPAPRGRVPRRWPAAVPVSRRRGIAGRPRCRPAIRRSRCGISATIELGAPQGRRSRARERASPTWVCTTCSTCCSTTRAAGSTARRRVDIADARSGRGGDRHRRGAHGARPPHAQRPRAGGGRDPRRLVDAQRHVLQPGLAREAARGRHRGRRSSASSTCTAASGR